jgi:hypothetical protein
MSLSSGAISELRVASILIEYGWEVAFPFTHARAWDFIIHRDGISRTIQVKGAAYSEYSFTSIKTDWKRYDKIDYIILHDQVHQNFYVFTKGELSSRRSITLNPNKLTQQLNNWKRIQ